MSVRKGFEALTASAAFVTEDVSKICYRSLVLEVFQLCERADDIITTL